MEKTWTSGQIGFVTCQCICKENLLAVIAKDQKYNLETVLPALLLVFFLPLYLSRLLYNNLKQELCHNFKITI